MKNFLDIHKPNLIKNHDVSETRDCLRHRVKPNMLGPVDTAGPYL
jgi:hypothetical protein